MQNRIDRNKPLGNEDGIALVTALMLGLFGMLMVAALLFMVNTGTWTGGGQKRYQTALAAAQGGNEFFVKEVIQRGVGNGETPAVIRQRFIDDGVTTLELKPIASQAVFNNKLTTPGPYPPYDPRNPASQPDAVIIFPIANGPDITVSATIVNTSPGNSGAGSVLEPPGDHDPGGLVHRPYLYQIQVIGSANPGGTQGRVEQARLNSLYVY